MDELRKDKIRQATKEVTEVFRKLDLNMTEIEIVTRSGNVGARVRMAMKEMEDEAREYIEKSQTKATNKIVMILPAIASITAIVISIISILATVRLKGRAGHKRVRYAHSDTESRQDNRCRTVLRNG